MNRLYSVILAALLVMAFTVPVAAQQRTSCPSMTYTFSETQLTVRVFGFGDYVSGTVTDNKTTAVIPRTAIWNGWLKKFTVSYNLVNDSGLTASLVFEGEMWGYQFVSYCTLRRGTGLITIYR